MEQEPDSPILYNTLRRVGYNLAIAAHAVFIVISMVAAIILMTALLIG